MSTRTFKVVLPCTVRTREFNPKLTFGENFDHSRYLQLFNLDGESTPLSTNYQKICADSLKGHPQKWSFQWCYSKHSAFIDPRTKVEDVFRQLRDNPSSDGGDFYCISIFVPKITLLYSAPMQNSAQASRRYHATVYLAICRNNIKDDPSMRVTYKKLTGFPDLVGQNDVPLLLDYDKIMIADTPPKSKIEDYKIRFSGRVQPAYVNGRDLVKNQTIDNAVQLISLSKRSHHQAIKLRSGIDSARNQYPTTLFKRYTDGGGAASEEKSRHGGDTSIVDHRRAVPVAGSTRGKRRAIIATEQPDVVFTGSIDVKGKTISDLVEEGKAALSVTNTDGFFPLRQWSTSAMQGKVTQYAVDPFKTAWDSTSELAATKFLDMCFHATPQYIWYDSSSNAGFVFHAIVTNDDVLRRLPTWEELPFSYVSEAFRKRFHMHQHSFLVINTPENATVAQRFVNLCNKWNTFIAVRKWRFLNRSRTPLAGWSFGEETKFGRKPPKGGAYRVVKRDSIPYGYNNKVLRQQYDTLSHQIKFLAAENNQTSPPIINDKGQLILNYMPFRGNLSDFARIQDGILKFKDTMPWIKRYVPHSHDIGKNKFINGLRISGESDWSGCLILPGHMVCCFGHVYEKETDGVVHRHHKVYVIDPSCRTLRPEFKQRWEDITKKSYNQFETNATAEFEWPEEHVPIQSYEPSCELQSITLALLAAFLIEGTPREKLGSDGKSFFITEEAFESVVKCVCGIKVDTFAYARFVSQFAFFAKLAAKLTY